MLVDRRNSDPSRKRNSRRCGRTPLVHANRERTSANVVSNGHGIFLHGSMSAEVVPESVLRAFIRVYPDLFATNDLTHLGLIADSEFGWPIGISRTNVKHLGGLPSLGINCASCHVAQITSKSVKEPIRIMRL